MTDKRIKAVAEAGECLQGIDTERLAGWNHYYAISQQGNTSAHNEAKYAVRNQWRHILAMANALHEENARLRASAKYVPALAGTLSWLGQYIRNYCIVVHPKSTQSGLTPEEVMLRKIDSTLALLPEES